MLAYDDNFKEDNIKLNDFIKLHKYKAEMNKHPERYYTKSSYILFQNDEIILFFDTKFDLGDFEH